MYWVSSKQAVCKWRCIFVPNIVDHSFPAVSSSPPLGPPPASQYILAHEQEVEKLDHQSAGIKHSHLWLDQKLACLPHLQMHILGFTMAETLCLSQKHCGGVLTCSPCLFLHLYHVPAGLVWSYLLFLRFPQTLKWTERLATKALDQNFLVSLLAELINKVFQSLDWRSVLSVRRVSALPKIVPTSNIENRLADTYPY
jgi:hypothetical protein